MGWPDTYGGAGGCARVGGECCSPGRGSPELPAQLLEEKANGEEAQGGRGGEHAGPVILQVPPQAAGEGLLGKGTERLRLGTQARPPAQDLKGMLELGTGVAATLQPWAPFPKEGAPAGLLAHPGPTGSKDLGPLQSRSPQPRPATPGSWEPWVSGELWEG